MGASVRGASHVALGMPRQDHLWVGGHDRDRIFAAVMCDGAGGVSHGGAGAAIAVRTMRSLVLGGLLRSCAVPPPDVLAGWVLETGDALARAAAAHRLDRGALATTLLVAVSDGHATSVAHVGDGFVALKILGPGGWDCVSAPERGEYAGTTSFLTDDRIAPRSMGVVAPVERICLSTDGLEPIAWNEAAACVHAPFLDGIAAALPSLPGRGAGACGRLERWLSSPGLQARVHDDLSLCIAGPCAA